MIGKIVRINKPGSSYHGRVGCISDELVSFTDPPYLKKIWVRVIDSFTHEFSNVPLNVDEIQPVRSKRPGSNPGNFKQQNKR